MNTIWILQSPDSKGYHRHEHSHPPGTSQSLEDLQNRLSSLFGSAPGRRTDSKEDITLAEWAPLADITEDDKEYLIKLELPEVKRRT